MSDRAVKTYLVSGGLMVGAGLFGISGQTETATLLVCVMWGFILGRLT